MPITLLDPKVSEIKFNKEVESYRKQERILRKRGWILESALFPIVRVTFITIQVNPTIAPLTIDIDFTNYNILAPSVRFLNPATLDPIFVPGIRKLPDGNVQNLMVQAHPNTKEPFICMPGIREYHNHPQHDGNSWDLHRYTGEGTLFFILDKIWTYCIKSINGFELTMQLSYNGVE